jgi:hypothetical protein
MSSNQTNQSAADPNSKDLDEKIRRLSVEGHNATEIARDCPAPLDQVNDSVQRYHTRLDNLPTLSVRCHLERLVDELNLVRQEAWSAWKRSTALKAKLSEKQTTGGPSGVRSDVTQTEETQSGDTACLRVIENCIKCEAALRGVEKHARLQSNQRIRSLDELKAIIAKHKSSEPS